MRIDRQHVQEKTCIHVVPTTLFLEVNQFVPALVHVPLGANDRQAAADQPLQVIAWGHGLDSRRRNRLARQHGPARAKHRSIFCRVHAGTPGKGFIPPPRKDKHLVPERVLSAISGERLRHPAIDDDADVIHSVVEMGFHPPPEPSGRIAVLQRHERRKSESVTTGRQRADFEERILRIYVGVGVMRDSDPPEALVLFFPCHAQIAVGIHQAVQVDHRKTGEVADDAGVVRCDHASFGQHAVRRQSAHVKTHAVSISGELICSIDILERQGETGLGKQSRRPGNDNAQAQSSGRGA